VDPIGGTRPRWSRQLMAVPACVDTAGRALHKRMALVRDRGERRTFNPEILATVLG
jgi:hypothetical protein